MVKLSDAALNLVAIVVLVIAGLLLVYGGYRHAHLECHCAQLEEALEQCEAEKALLEALIGEDDTSFSIGNGNQGWIPPTAMEK